MTDNFCFECGTALRPNAKFCSSCGISLAEDAVENTPIPAPKSEPASNITKPFPSQENEPTPTVPVQRLSKRDQAYMSEYGVPRFTFFEAIGSGLRNYFNFEDRSSRSAYWFFALFTYLAITAWQVYVIVMFGEGALILLLADILLFFPQISLLTRRLHDVGKSGWNQLWAFTIIGIPYIFYLTLQPSKGPNKYGDHPLMPDRETSSNSHILYVIIIGLSIAFGLIALVNGN